MNEQSNKKHSLSDHLEGPTWVITRRDFLKASGFVIAGLSMGAPFAYADEKDWQKIYLWLTQSDLTSSIMGSRDYSDHAMPTWDKFCDDYPLSFFNPSGDGKGRNYIIVINDEKIGTIGYDLLDKQKDRVVLDIWMQSGKYQVQRLVRFPFRTYQFSR